MEPTAEERSIVDDYPLCLPGIDLEEQSKPCREALSGLASISQDSLDQIFDPHAASFSFTKGSVLFHAETKAGEKGAPYLTISPEPKGKPILRLEAETREEPMSLAEFKQKLDAVVSEAFYKRQLDPHDLLPKDPYLTVHCGKRAQACLNIARGLLEHPTSRDHLRILFQADIGDIRMRIRYHSRSAYLYNQDFFEANLLQMRDPSSPNEGGARDVTSFVIPRDVIQQARDGEDFRKYLNCQLTAYSRGNEPLLHPLYSSWHAWMRYELIHAKELSLDGYRDQNGSRHTCANNEAFREVMSSALLQEPISKTIWLKEKNEKIEDFQFLGPSRGDTNGISFVILDKDRMPLTVPPDAIIPSQMRATGCPFTEKEYGIPLKKIPKPIQERGIYPPPKGMKKEMPRKEQILALAEKRIQMLAQELHQTFGIDQESSLRAIHKATIAVKEKPAEKDRIGH